MPEISPTAPYEDRAKNILKAELKRRGITYAQLADKLSLLGISENERNLANKISRGSFTAAFFMICLLYTSPSPRDLSTSRMPSSA